MASGLNIVLIGPPGAGKSTQAKAIGAKYGLPHLSTGNMLRDAIAKGGDLGEALRDIVASGAMAPEFLMVKMISERLAQPDCKDGFVLDGFPRNKQQAELLNQILKKQGRALDSVIEIQVSDENVERRICGRFQCRECDAGYHVEYNRPANDNECDDCGAENSFVKRSDDAPAVVYKRLALYKQLTEKTLLFYKQANILDTVDGNFAPDEIKRDIFKILDRKMTPPQKPKGPSPKNRR